MHLRGWSYDPSKAFSPRMDIDMTNLSFQLGSLSDRRGTKCNVSFDLKASCVEHCFPQTANLSRTMELGRIDSVPPKGTASAMKDEEEDQEQSSTISFHVSTKYVYTLTFSSTITMGRGTFYKDRLHRWDFSFSSKH